MFVWKPCANNDIAIQAWQTYQAPKVKSEGYVVLPHQHCIVHHLTRDARAVNSSVLFQTGRKGAGRVWPLSPTITAGRPQSVPQDPNISENFLQQN